MQIFWVLIHAEFSKVEDLRDDIYDCLESVGWEKIHTSKINLSTTWKKSFQDNTASHAKVVAVKDFMSCIPSGITVKLVVHAGLTEPNVHEWRIKK